MVARPRLNRERLSVVLILLVIVIFLVGFQLGKTRVTTGSVLGKTSTTREDGQPGSVDFSLFWSVWKRVTEEFPEAIDPQKSVYGAISGAIRSLGDPYSDFFTPEETKEFEQEISGTFSGIGIEIGERDGRIVVIAPLDGTPAQLAGLLAGDTIRKIDDKDIEGASVAQVVKSIRGKEGTSVKLSIQRNTESTLKEFTITRENIQVSSLTLEERRTPAGKKVSVIKISQFSDDTERRLMDATSKILLANPAAIIVDLRNNPGGFFETAIDVASDFLDTSPVAREVDKSGKVIERKASREAKLKPFKLLVLVNKGSASASEIVAGAIQDYQAGKLMGETTFGKGTVQNFEKLVDGSSLKITIGKWQTAKGREINKVGIKPDVEVKDDPTTPADEVLDTALKELDQ